MAAASAGAKSCPITTAAAIEDGALDGWHLEICWLRSQIDVLFAQIQGSARIKLEDGTILRVNYDSHNGWPYTPVGRVLIERKFLTKDEMSMQRIRDWMQANPDLAQDVRRQNKSYVFFRITDLATEDEAIGAQGVPLVPGRSIAVDRALHAYGTPFFIAADLPIANDKGGTKFRRLMFAQDTGSAIVGPARADIYFGAGAEAARMAGRIRNPGQFVMLIPRELDPVEAARAVPLPPERAGFFAQLTAGTMIDPTAEDVPLPEPRPAAAAQPDPAPKPKARRRAMSRRHPLSDEDHALWTGFVRSIKPLRRVQRLAEPSAGEKPSSQPPPAAPRPVARLETLPEKKPPALAPLGRRLKQRVARGREAIDARLDLHGYTQTQAHAALLRFLQRAQADGARIALVVTGKGMGRGSDQRERGVLKRQVPMWLSLPQFRSLVVGFEDAHLGHGGEGALYVRLRRAR